MCVVVAVVVVVVVVVVAGGGGGGVGVVVVVVVVVVEVVVAELLAVTGRDGHVGGNEITTIRSSIACVDLVSSHISIASGNPTTS